MSPNPFNYPPRQATALEFGVGHSGPSTIVAVGDVKQILNISVAEIVPQGYYGMATIHITVRDHELSPGGSDLAANDRLIGHVSWQSGNSGGDEDLDLTRGRILTVGATTAIVIDQVRLVPANDAPLVPWSSKLVETTVCWFTSANPQPAQMTAESVVLAPGVASDWIPIPLGARDMGALGFPAAAYATLIAEFSTNDNVGGNGIRYQVPDPFRNGAWIVQGVNFVRFVNTVAMEVFPVFDLMT